MTLFACPPLSFCAVRYGGPLSPKMQEWVTDLVLSTNRFSAKEFGGALPVETQTDSRTGANMLSMRHKSETNGGTSPLFGDNS